MPGAAHGRGQHAVGRGIIGDLFPDGIPGQFVSGQHGDGHQMADRRRPMTDLGRRHRLAARPDGIQKILMVPGTAANVDLTGTDKFPQQRGRLGFESSPMDMDKNPPIRPLELQPPGAFAVPYQPNAVGVPTFKLVRHEGVEQAVV